MSLFKQTAIKIAHSSTLTSLGANKDLRHLQKLIAAEKTVLNSLQKLSDDIAKASDALKTWSMDEGDDLKDVLSGSSTILSLFSTALSDYSERESGIRELMKGVREREEDFKELKRLRRLLGVKADAAEKRVNKLQPEHKNFEQQTEILAGLRKDVEAMDAQILAEEAELGDFKRSAVREWMALKFGGLLDSSAKGKIIGEQGGLLIAEIPDEKTQPGAPRTVYSSHSNTKGLISETERSVAAVSKKSATSATPRSLSKRHSRSRSSRSNSHRIIGSRRKGSTPNDAPLDDAGPNESKTLDADTLDAPPDGVPPKDFPVHDSTPKEQSNDAPNDTPPEVDPASVVLNGLEAERQDDEIQS